jgi:hypothetical protein
MAIPKRLRYEVLRRDNFTCRYCGAKAPDVKITVDHVMPDVLEGPTKASNLVAACSDCNSGKSSTIPDAPLVEQVNEDALRYARALSQVIEERAARFSAESGYLDRFDKQWCSWTNPPMDRAADWESSILNFLSAGVSEDYILRAVNTAMGKRYISGRKLWAYFCGICWNEVRAIQAAAATLANGTLPAANGPAASVNPERENPAPWVYFADYLTCDLFNLITGVEDCEEFDQLLSNQVWAAMQVMFTAFYASLAEGEDRDSAEDQAKDCLSEADEYTQGIAATRAAFKAAMERQAGSDGA